MTKDRFNKGHTTERLLYGGDLSKYGKDFQIKLLSLLSKDRIFAFSILPILKDEYFSDIWLRKIFLCIRDYTQEYSSTPTMDNIKIKLQDKEEKISSFEPMLESIETISLEDRDFVIDNSRRFCFTKHRLIELEKEKILLEQGDFEKAQRTSIESYKHAGTSNRQIYDLKTDYEKIFEDDIHHRPVPTPFPTINKCTKGGPGSGNLVIAVAPSNFGKTAVLTACAREANRLGKNVAFFSFEIGGEDILRRYIAGQLGVKQEELKFHKKEVKSAVIDDTLGNFRLIQERATLATIEQIHADLEYLKSTGFFPDMVCVDSLNQLKLLGENSWRMKDDNQKFELLSEQLRDLANDLKIPFMTVMQTNRTGFGEAAGNIMSIGKAIEPFQVADILWMFNQTLDLEAEGICILTMLKNRLGPKNIALECKYDPNMGTFKEIKEVNALLLKSDKEKSAVKTTIVKMREKLKSGDFNSEKQ